MTKVKVSNIGCDLYGSLVGGKWDHINESCRRVYRASAISPTLTTCGGGNQEVKIVEDFTPRESEDDLLLNKEINPNVVMGIGEKNCNNGTQWHEQDRVYDSDQVATALPAGIGFSPYYTEPKIETFNVVQPVIKRENNNIDKIALCQLLKTHKIKSGLTNKDISDALNVPVTKVEHWFRTDNHFAIPTPDVWSSLKDMLNISSTQFDDDIMNFTECDGVYDKSNRVYGSSGISPTITSTDADVKIINDPSVSFVGGIGDKDRIGDGKTSLYVEHCEPFIVASRGRNPENPTDRTPGNYVEQQLEPKYDGTSNTLTTVAKDNYVAEPTERNMCMSLKDKQNDLLDKLKNKKLRVRKLTPKECWRLMAFDDEDFDKAVDAGVSNSQLYKQAGNSIVADVLVAIFGQMLEGKEDFYKNVPKPYLKQE